MTPEIGRDYIGPFGRTYRVVDIEDNGGYRLVVIQAIPAQGEGRAWFPIDQSAKWLAPLSHSGHDAIGDAAYAE